MPRKRDPFYLLLALCIVLVIVLNFLFYRKVTISDAITVQDRQLRYRLIPDLDGARVVIPGRPTPPSFQLSFAERQKNKDQIMRTLIFEVNTNSQGFRNAEFSAKPAPGTFRIVCLGDSITFGWGMDEKYSYPRVLERYLNSRPGAKTRVEVINAGVPGYDLEQITLYLTNKILSLKPHLVTVCKLGDLKAEKPHVKYERQLAGIASIGQQGGAAAAFLCPPKSSFDLYPLTPQFRDTMERAARKQNVLFADFMTLFNHEGKNKGLKLELDGAHQRLVDYIDGKGTTVFEADFTPQPGSPNRISPEIYRFMDETSYAEALFFDDGHPNREGFEIMGEHLGKLLLDAGVIR